MLYPLSYGSNVQNSTAIETGGPTGHPQHEITEGLLTSIQNASLLFKHECSSL
jgi:hypothetical protein